MGPHSKKEVEGMYHPRSLWSRLRKTLLMSLHRARIAVIEQVTDMRLLLISMRTPQGARASWRSVQPFVVFAGR